MYRLQWSLCLFKRGVLVLEGCPHCRVCYVQASIELGLKDVSPLEGVMYRLQWSRNLKI